MSYQSPLICIPRKTTSDVDFGPPIRSTISQLYHEDPANYASEITLLSRTRQDALRGSAGSDLTARDLLYKYFGQLELLELRFAEIRLPFNWQDAFTGKHISQMSLAYEKASVIFNIAATLSSLAQSQNRTSPEGIKRTYHFLRCSAGMFSYINENFLHAPSTDLSRDVVKVLTQLMIAQAFETFYETTKEPQKGLRSKICMQASMLYASIVEDVKDFVSRSIFERTWSFLVQCKSKYYLSLAHYHRAKADQDSKKHGEAIARLKVAEPLAKEASRFAGSLQATFIPSVHHGGIMGSSSSSHQATLMSDSALSLSELTKANLSQITHLLTESNRENDLIYNSIVPSESALPQIEPLSSVGTTNPSTITSSAAVPGSPPASAPEAATSGAPVTKPSLGIAEPISIQEVYSNPDVQKVVGPDIFAKLVPLSVHESASLYSEEKAKLVRSVGEKCDLADGELGNALETMGLPAAAARFRDYLRKRAGDTGYGARGLMEEMVDPGSQVRRWAEEVREAEDGGRVVDELSAVERQKDKAKATLDKLKIDLDNEFRECEQMRVKYMDHFTQTPSATENKTYRESIKSSYEDLTRAAQSDNQVQALWSAVAHDIAIFCDPNNPDEALERAFSEAIVGGAEFGSDANGKERHKKRQSLIDIDDGELNRLASSGDQGEEDVMREKILAIDEDLDRLQKIKKERTEVFKDLKEKVQADDISHLLILNRKNTSVEPTLFQTELEKYRQHQNRIEQSVAVQQETIQLVASNWQELVEGRKGREIQNNWVKADKKRKEVVMRFQRARDGYWDVRAGLNGATTFYGGMNESVDLLRQAVAGFISKRNKERGEMVSAAEIQQRLSSPAPPHTEESRPPPQAVSPPLSTPVRSLEQSVAAMELASKAAPTPPPLSATPSISTYPGMPTTGAFATGPPAPSRPPRGPSMQQAPNSPTNQFGAPPPPTQPAFSPPPPSAQYSQPPPPPPSSAYNPQPQGRYSYSQQPGYGVPPTNTSYSIPSQPTPTPSLPPKPQAQYSAYPPQHSNSLPPPPQPLSYQSNYASGPPHSQGPPAPAQGNSPYPPPPPPQGQWQPPPQQQYPNPSNGFPPPPSTPSYQTPFQSPPVKASYGAPPAPTSTPAWPPQPPPGPPPPGWPPQQQAQAPYGGPPPPTNYSGYYQPPPGY